MSSSPSGTVPATSSDSNSGGCKADVNQTTCLAGPPTFRRAMIRATLVGRTSDMVDTRYAYATGGDVGLTRRWAAPPPHARGRSHQILFQPDGGAQPPLTSGGEPHRSSQLTRQCSV